MMSPRPSVNIGSVVTRALATYSDVWRPDRSTMWSSVLYAPVRNRIPRLSRSRIASSIGVIFSRFGMILRLPLIEDQWNHPVLSDIPQPALSDAQGRDGRERQHLHGQKWVGSHAAKLVERLLNRDYLRAQG